MNENQFKRFLKRQQGVKQTLEEIQIQLTRLQKQYDLFHTELNAIERELKLFDEGHEKSCCVACGKSVTEAEHCISGGQYLYEDEGEWVCSDECHAKVEQGEENKRFACSK